MWSSRSDAIGMCAAAVCAVHCIATPLIVGILPVIGLPLLDPRTEWLLLSVSLTISSLAVFSGCVRHRRWVPFGSFAFGAALLLASRLVLDDDGTAARAAVAAGAGFVVGAHVLNIRLCRCTAGAPQCS
jgi:hypothetical protein